MAFAATRYPTFPYDSRRRPVRSSALSPPRARLQKTHNQIGRSLRCNPKANQTAHLALGKNKFKYGLPQRRPARGDQHPHQLDESVTEQTHLGGKLRIDPSQRYSSAMSMSTHTQSWAHQGCPAVAVAAKAPLPRAPLVRAAKTSIFADASHRIVEVSGRRRQHSSP